MRFIQGAIIAIEKKMGGYWEELPKISNLSAIFLEKDLSYFGIPLLVENSEVRVLQQYFPSYLFS